MIQLTLAKSQNILHVKPSAIGCMWMEDGITKIRIDGITIAVGELPQEIIDRINSHDNRASTPFAR